MSSAQRQRRYLDKIRGTGADRASQLEELKSENARLQQLLTEAEERIRKLEARLERPQPKPKPKPQPKLDEEELLRRFRALEEKPSGILYLKQGSRRMLLSALHPDGIENPAAKQRHEIAFQLITDLFASGYLRETGG
jgi:hypothetical protein